MILVITLFIAHIYISLIFNFSEANFKISDILSKAYHFHHEESSNSYDNSFQPTSQWVSIEIIHIFSFVSFRIIAQYELGSHRIFENLEAICSSLCIHHKNSLIFLVFCN